MKNNKTNTRKHCNGCGMVLDAIWFTALMTEEWSWN